MKTNVLQGKTNKKENALHSRQFLDYIYNIQNAEALQSNAKNAETHSKKPIDTTIKTKKEFIHSTPELIISPLSNESDPKVAKLKEELSKLQVNPKQKYIKVKF